VTRPVDVTPRKAIRFFSTLVDSHVCTPYNMLMGYRQHNDSSTSPILSNTRGAGILGVVLIIIGVTGLALGLSRAGAVVFILGGIGVIFLSIGDEIIQWVAVALFGIALVSLGFALCQLLS